METNLVNLMFTQIISNLQSFIANDITVMLLGMLTIVFIIFAYFKIREFLNIGMSEEEINAKNAYSRWQAGKGSWRAPLLKEDYEVRLAELRTVEFFKNEDMRNEGVRK